MRRWCRLGFGFRLSAGGVFRLVPAMLRFLPHPSKLSNLQQKKQQIRKQCSSSMSPAVSAVCVCVCVRRHAALKHDHGLSGGSGGIFVPVAEPRKANKTEKKYAL